MAGVSAPVTLPLLVQVATTLPLVGLIWLVQLVVYPQFGRVGTREFTGYHAAHARGITWIVAPLMLGELGAAIAWVVADVSFLQIGGLVLVVIVWGATGVLSVPQHDVLARGYAATAHARLVATNWVRTCAWTARGVLVVAALRGSP